MTFATSGSIEGMKLSVSLPDADVAFLDAYARKSGVESRSAAVHRAIALLQGSELSAAYEDAWDEWSSSDDAALWDSAVGDGLG